MDGVIDGSALDGQFNLAIAVLLRIGQINGHGFFLITIRRNAVGFSNVIHSIGNQRHSGIQRVVPDVAHRNGDFIFTGVQFELIGDSSGADTTLLLVMRIAGGFIFV